MLIASVALLVLSQTPQHRLFMQPNLPRSSLAFFEAFPASGAGLTTACSTTPPTCAGRIACTIATARSTVAECYSNDGQTLTQIAANVTRVSSGRVDSTWMGAWSERAATQLAAQPRDLSNAAWVKTNMSCPKTATGMRNDANGASACTASAGNGTVVTTIVAGAATRNGSLHIKRLVGTGVVEVTSDGATWTPITASVSSTRWRRVVNEEAPGCAGGDCIVVSALQTTGANPSLGVRLVTSGDSVAIDFAQIEAGVEATSPIATAISRGADSVTATIPSTRLESLAIQVQPTAGLNSLIGYIWAQTTTADYFRAQMGAGAGNDMSNACHSQTGGVGYSVSQDFLVPRGFGGFVNVGCDFTTATRTNVVNGATTSTTAATVMPSVTTIYMGALYTGGYEGNGVVRGACGDTTAGACRARMSYDYEDHRIAWIGDSISAGAVSAPTRPPDVLAGLRQSPVQSLALPGKTAAECLSNWRAHGAGKGYSTVVVMCGINTILGGGTAVTTLASLTPLFDEIRATGARLVLLTLTPWGNWATWSAPAQAEVATINAAITAYCSTYGATCVDAYTALSAGGGTPEDMAAIYDSGDGLHPNAAGSTLLATIVEAAL